MEVRNQYNHPARPELADATQPEDHIYTASVWRDKKLKKEKKGDLAIPRFYVLRSFPVCSESRA